MKSLRRISLSLWFRLRELLDHHPHLIVQLLPLKGYYLLFVVIYLKLFPEENFAEEKYSAAYIPPSPKPYEGFMSDMMDPEITFVTAYFNLGRFQKGEGGNLHFDLNNYVSWMKEFENFNNSIIAFTDLPEIRTQLLMLRKHFPRERTKVFLINQNETWAFKLAPKIKKIFAQDGYPKHHPNTVIERYPCAMHVKYELIEKVVRERMFRTKYLAWIDIGYFREKHNGAFHLQIPTDFKDDHIAFLQMGEFEPERSETDIISANVYWVAGGIFIGRPEYLLPFVEDYKLAVESLIKKNLMSTDQQVIYIMYKGEGNKDSRPRIPLQAYRDPMKTDWFYLGRLCLQAWQKSLNVQRFTIVEAYHRMHYL
ncbi:uncharacterized protein [Argopecten irradians]|uniref:uncharacterized protein isoform X2 n=1 Tax=Argopecten irradians TaxID=31199 RepID=UPI00371BBBEC